ncbi:type II toxin-antitoxin system VapC family toxin [Haladaptatus sp. NG-SE-30]
MPSYFFDTSALVKRYYDEQGTDVVDTIIEPAENNILITSLAVIETVSAFRRKQNRDSISREEVDSLLAAFFDEALADFQIVPLDEQLFDYAFELILEDDLRTLDSLQLSAARALATNVEDLTFVCADKKLVDVAQSKELPAINPTTDDAQ